MSDSQDAIERVLAGLRDAGAPAGMERRILEGLEGRVSTVEVRSSWRWLVPSRALIFGAALAGVVAAVLVVPAIRRFGHSTEQSNAGVLPGAAVRRTTPATTAGVAGPSAIGHRVKQGMTAKASDARLVRVGDSGEADTEDDVARSEMEAASFPAPPMPLTAQERLLLRLAHKVDPVEVAMLDPKFRAIEDAKEKAEFQRFFGQTARQPLPAQLPPGQSAAEQGAPGPSSPKQAAPEQTTTEQTMPDQVAPTEPDQSTSDQPPQDQSKPQKMAPDQSTTMQQLMPRPIRTGENE